MKCILTISNLIYTIFVYMYIYIYYISNKSFYLFIILLIIFCAFYISLTPVVLRNLGYKLSIRLMALDFYFKVFQLIILFFLTPLIKINYIVLLSMIFTALLLYIHLNLIKDIIQYDVSFYTLNKKLKESSQKNAEKEKLIHDAWVLIFPFAFSGFIDINSNLFVKIVICIIIVLFEFVLLNKIYKKLLVLADFEKSNFKKIILIYIFQVFLEILIILLQPGNPLYYLLASTSVVTIVSYISGLETKKQ